MEAHKITLRNEIEELQKITIALEQLEADWSLPAKVVMNMNLALEEVVSNVIFYAFEDDAAHEIDVVFQRKDEKLHVHISDDGKAFNPVKTPPPADLAKKAEERNIGGLGIYFVKKFMDDMVYKREQNKNILTLVKKITG